MKTILAVHGEEVTGAVRGPPWILVSSGNRVVRVDAHREARIPEFTESGFPLVQLFLQARGAGRKETSLETEGVPDATIRWTTTTYLEPLIVVDGIKLLVGTSSLS